MKPNWIVEYLNIHDYNYQRNHKDYEIWFNNLNLIVIHPEKGVILMYRLSINDISHIDKDIEDWEIQMGTKLKNTSN